MGRFVIFFLKKIKEKNDDAQLLKIAMAAGKQTNKESLMVASEDVFS